MSLMWFKFKLARAQWLIVLLAVLLQRSPAIRVLTILEKSLSRPVARIVQGTTWLATTMGVFHATAGATGLLASRDGGSFRTVDETYVAEIGEQVTLAFKLDDPSIVSWEVDFESDLVEGLDFINANGEEVLAGPFERTGGPSGINKYYTVASSVLILNGIPTTASVVATIDDPAKNKNVLGIKAYATNGGSEGGWYGIQIEVPLAPPEFLWEPRSISVPTGGRAQFFFEAEEGVDTVQWLRNGDTLSGQTGPTLILTDTIGTDAGVYSVSIKKDGAERISAGATLTIDDDAAAATVELSNQGFVGQEGDVLVSRLAIEGPSAATILLRGLGPDLEGANAPGFLSDPRLELSRMIFEGEVEVGAQQLLSNDNWEADPNAVEIAAVLSDSGKLLEAGSKDAAILVTLPEGVYKIKLSGDSEWNGIGLAEMTVIE
ncbi:MAG: hypothetical protein ACJ07L_13010 [Opitutales bacterium]